MFNESIKNKFLSQSENREKYIALFNKVTESEHNYSIDLYDFNSIQIRKFAEDKRELVLIRNYIDWAILQAYRYTNVNPLI